MYLKDLINPGLLRHDIDEGLIRVQRHPALPLSIYNYTEKAQFSRTWNTATLNCRGLIADDDGWIVARPFPKFFNWDEKPPKGQRFKMDLDEPVVVTDKLDGSLGILYPAGNGNYHIATRGSFTSNQALHASAVWWSKYEKEFGYRINPRMTYLFEIIYPENRIVVDYNGMDDLVLLGAVDKETGFIYGPEFFPGWPGPSARVFPHRTLRKAVSAKPRAGKEGFVVRSLSDGLMVKVKYDDYVSLHKVVTGLNEKEIWRRCMKADLLTGCDKGIVDVQEEILRDIPDEMHQWVTGVAQRLYTSVVSATYQAHAVFMQALPSRITGLSDRDARKRFAQRIQGREPWLRTVLWMMYDDKSPREFLWKRIEPKGDVKK